MKRARTLSPVVLAAGSVALFLTVLSLPAPGQQPGARLRQFQLRGANLAQNGEGQGLEAVFLPPDRQAKRRLELAEELIKEERYGEAVRLLGSLLEGHEDFFFKPDGNAPVYRSLKAEAGRLLGGLSREGRQSYELQYGAEARKMLEEAAAKGDPQRVAEVARRFFHTQAGADATYLVGRHYLDQNRPLAAALCFERLLQLGDDAQRLEPALSMSLATCWLRAGKPDKAVDTLKQLRRRAGDEITIGGRQVKLFADDAQALAWMDEQLGKQSLAAGAESDQWVMFRGDETRNAPSAGGRPLLSVRWRQRTCDDAAIEEFVAKLRHDYLGQDIVALPSMHPLAVSDVVLMRTAFALQAVDFETGKLVWRYATGDESLEQFLRAMAAQRSAQTSQQLLWSLDQRMWDDATYGTLSSDGRRVFFIEDLGLQGLSSNAVMTVQPNGTRRFSTSSDGTNRLAARELRTQGKLKWVVGGVTGEDEPKLAGAFFLGPPLPLLGSLYALAEMKGQEVRLVALSAETGALEWSQQLAVVDPPVQLDSHRRSSGASPSFADGVLVCPTTAGAIVGIDLSTRSLLWGYQYPRGVQYGVERFNVRAAIYAGSQQQRSNDHWADASVTIADGSVLITPVETDQLYCLRLADGAEQWKQARGANLYVACVHDSQVVLVGHHAVSALKLADGTKAWPDLELPAGSVPSGRGYHSGEHYYLPLSSAEVAKINLRTGKIEARARSRSGDVPGNLVCYRDSIISQGAEYLDAYYQLDSLKQRVSETLADKPDDPQALAAAGEVKLDEGALAEAIDLFRRSYQLAPDPTTRGLLIDSLLEGLRVDFAAYRQRLDELEQLIEQPRQRLDYLRLVAEGLQRAGEVLPAFEAYLKLIDEEPPAGLDEVAEHLSVRRDRWIREQLARLRAAADPSAEQRIDAAVAARLEAALASSSTDQLRTFLSLFGAQPAAGRAREALVARLGADELLEKNLLLERQILSANDAEAAPATARLAAALAQAGQPALAAVYYRELAGRFANVPALEGRTGREVVAALAASDPVRKHLVRPDAWPVTDVSVSEKAEANPVQAPRVVRSARAAAVELLGRRGPLFDNVTLSLAFGAQQQLIADDGLGIERFRLLLTEQGMQRALNRNAYNQLSLNYGRVYGGMLVLALGTELVAVDTLRGGDAATSKVLWTENLSDQIGGLQTMQGIVPRAVNQRWGQPRYVAEDSFGRRYGTIGPLSENGVCFQRLHDLHCVDPLTGKTIWTRRNVPLGLDLFGDDEFLFAAPAGDAETLVLSAATGELVGKRRIPKLEDRMTALGRRLLVWQPTDKGNALDLRDVAAEKVLWSYPFPAGSKAAVVGQEVVGVLQPNGEFALVRLADGKQLAAHSLKVPSAVLGIHLLPSPAGYLLAINAAARSQRNLSVQPFPNPAESPLVNGPIYAFDRHDGRQLWPQPVEVTQHGLFLGQPGELPLLVLMRQVHRAGPSSVREPKLSVMCIDKRSGRVVYSKDELPGTTVPSCEIAGDPAARTVTITLPNRAITLEFMEEQADPQAARPVVPALPAVAATVDPER